MESRLPPILTQADDVQRLPRLGGMARPDGVVIVSERFWVFAGVDGSLREGEMPQPPRFARHVPLVRGLIRLGASLSPLFRPTGVARRRERLVLALALLLPFGLVVVPERLTTLVGIVLTLGLLGWMLRGRTVNLHGAEHRAIAAAERRCRVRADRAGLHRAAARTSQRSRSRSRCWRSAPGHSRPPPTRRSPSRSSPSR
jgi:hypothetical protein